MIIETTNKTPEYVTFASLKVGEAFGRQVGDNIYFYLKVEQLSTEVNAVNLSKSSVARLKRFEKVYRINSKLIVEV